MNASRQLNRGFVVGLSLTVALLGFGARNLVAASPAPAAAAASALARIHIDNFGRVDDTYYRGAQPDGRDYDDLAALGVKTVIDLTQNGRSD